MEILIRKATEADVVRINEIMISGINDTIDFSCGDINKIDKWEENIDFLKNVLEREDHYLYVAQIQSEVIGAIYAYKQFTPEVPFFDKRKRVYIESLDVMKEYRNQGIGKKLIDQIEVCARETEANIVELEVYSRNRDANSLYEKMGYEIVKYKRKKHLR